MNLQPPPLFVTAIRTLLSTALLLTLVPPVHAAAITTLEQQLNISNGEFSTSSNTDSPTNNSLGLINYDSSQYTSPTVYFEALIKCVDCTGGNTRTKAALYNSTGTLQTSVTTTSSTYALVRSAPLSLGDADYTVRFSLDATAGTAYLKAARLIIVQSNSGGITTTQSQVELGGYTNSISTSATSMSAPKYYLYDSSQFTGTLNPYFEATLNTSGNDAEATSDFNDYDSGGLEWSTNPGYMVDGNSSNFASTDINSDTQTLTANANTGTDLGTITKVEISAYAAQSNDTTGSISLRPLFSGSSAGDNHNFTPGTSAAWSTYADITSDTNAPSDWSWSDIEDLDLNVIWNSNGGSNTGYVAQVRIRVTYEDDDILVYAQLYNLTEGAAVTNGTVSTSSNSPVRIRGSSALSTNFNTLDQYEVRIYTNNADYPVYLSNAKLILSQTQVEGIKHTETIQSSITSLRTQTNTIYTQESFLNQYDPDNFNSGNNHEAFFEATIRTTGETAYAQLYDVSSSELIATPVTSELTTTSGSWSRQRSSNLANNTDWPTSAATLDTLLKATDLQTTSVASSWLVIRTGAIDPQVTFTIEGLDADETQNGITTTVTSTITSLPFGHVSVSEPVFAGHKIIVSLNQATTSYTVDVKLDSYLQGQYPANNIDPFIGDGASWSSPQTWSSPTGTISNTNTGWIGVSTSDTQVDGWSNPSGLFGPLSDTSVEVGKSTTGESKTIYVLYGLEVNASQPADNYAGTLIYNFLPRY